TGGSATAITTVGGVPAGGAVATVVGGATTTARGAVVAGRWNATSCATGGSGAGVAGAGAGGGDAGPVSAGGAVGPSGSETGPSGAAAAGAGAAARWGRRPTAMSGATGEPVPETMLLIAAIPAVLAITAAQATRAAVVIEIPAKRAVAAGTGGGVRAPPVTSTVRPAPSAFNTIEARSATVVASTPGWTATSTRPSATTADVTPGRAATCSTGETGAAAMDGGRCNWSRASRDLAGDQRSRSRRIGTRRREPEGARSVDGWGLGA